MTKVKDLFPIENIKELLETFPDDDFKRDWLDCLKEGQDHEDEEGNDAKG